ncbi:uncharacterized protein LOC135926948 [Gordionus sp. m RMFG-2023]|uniref:uncharacterized protein LOC135926948 n=1 Tax=Gordionus sp. m RMFG-2023 TaxID=3053472 RepID=UPI0031FD7558
MINNYHFDTTPPILSHTNSLKLINNNNRMKYSLLLKSIFTPKSCNNNFKLQIKYFSKNSHLSEEELSQKIDHYSLLGLSFNSDNKAIKSAYYAKCKIYHPDSKVDQNARINSQTRADNFRKIAEAYECLIDPVKRQEYDKILFAKKSRMYENGSDFDKARKGFEKNRSSYRNVSNRYGSSFYDSSDDQNESTYDPNFWSARFEDQLKYQEDFDHASKNRPAQPYESRWWLARLEAMNTLNHKRSF